MCFIIGNALALSPACERVRFSPSRRCCPEQSLARSTRHGLCSIYRHYYGIHTRTTKQELLGFAARPVGVPERLPEPRCHRVTDLMTVRTSLHSMSLMYRLLPSVADCLWHRPCVLHFQSDVWAGMLGFGRNPRSFAARHQIPNTLGYCRCLTIIAS